jgi:acyl-coenzyme A synthetase/AMP-(fatty) acid ligase
MTSMRPLNSQATGHGERRRVRRTGLVSLVRGQFEPRLSLRRGLNVGLVAEQAAELHGRVPIYMDRPYDWDPQRRTEIDFVELASFVDEASGALHAAGVKPWDRVAIIKSPNYDIQPLAWAAARLGAIPAPLSALLDPETLDVLLERLQPRFLITDSATMERARIRPERLRALSCTAIGRVDAGAGISVDDVWGAAAPPPSPRRDDEPMLVTHTSSTTGVSKLVETCAKAAVFGAKTEAMVPFGHSSRELFAHVISHAHLRCMATQVASLARGTPMLGIAEHSDKTILSMFEKYRPSIVEAHPNQFVAWERLAEHPSKPFSSIRIFFTTFDATHPRTIRRLLDASKRTMPIWLQSYGLTEVQVVTVRVYTRRSARRLSSRDSRNVGWPVPGVRVRIVDPRTGRKVRRGEAGMIRSNSPARALSFVGTPDKYAERKHGDWFDTGDWGRKTRWGQLELLDRAADRIDGVESCLWIEDVLLDRIPDAEEVVVVPDERGQAVPVICMRDGKTLDPPAWRTASAGIAGIGDPVEVTHEQLKRTATEKARRYLLSEYIKAVATPEGAAAIAPEVLLRDGA